MSGPHGGEGGTRPVPRDGGSDWAAEQFKLAKGALEWSWGDAYVITVEAGEWKAVRRDGKREPLRAGSPTELRDAIWADYSALPVPRDPGRAAE